MRILPVLPLALAAVVASCETSTTDITTLGTPGFATTITPLVVSPAFIRIPIGTSAQLSVNVVDEFGSEVQWASFAPSIVSVDQSGQITGLDVGVATVRARFAFDFTNASVATVEVTPEPVPIVSVVPR
jgi:hypothetical protein